MDEIEIVPPESVSIPLNFVEESGGPYQEWEAPIPGEEYVMGIDPSHGRASLTDSERKGDHSCIKVFRTTMGEFVEVASWYGIVESGVLGEIAYDIACYYNYALINCERNESDAVLYALKLLDYPEDRLFRVARETKSDGAQDVHYWYVKHSKTQKELFDLFIYYASGRFKVMRLRCAATIHEIQSLQQEPDLTVNTNGKDRAVSVFMAVYADARYRFMPELPQRKKREADEVHGKVSRATLRRNGLALTTESQEDDDSGGLEFEPL